jgi:hypothetical protein
MMGPEGVLLIGTIGGAMLAAIGAGVFGMGTAAATEGVPKGRKKVIVAAAAFPFASLVWFEALLVFEWKINERFFQRDGGIGDEWKCPLPNGYALDMIDQPDRGLLYNPKTQVVGGGLASQPDAPGGVRLLQLAGPYMLGGSDTTWRLQGHLVDSYFLIDARTGKRADFGTYDALRDAASKLNIQLRLEQVGDVYSKYRFTWFDSLVDYVTAVPLVLYAGLLIWRILRLRKTRFLAPIAN